MSNEELLEALSLRFDRIDGRLDKLEDRLDQMEAHLHQVDVRLDALEESAEITRTGVNALLGWSEKCRNVIDFPLPQIN